MTNYNIKPIPEEKPLTGVVERPRGSSRQFANNSDSTVRPHDGGACGQRLSLKSHTSRDGIWISAKGKHRTELPKVTTPSTPSKSPPATGSRTSSPHMLMITRGHTHETTSRLPWINYRAFGDIVTNGL